MMKSQKVKMTYYDDIAECYDELHGEEQKRKALIILQELKIKPDDTLLDVGCGTGKITAMFPCKVQGIDPAKELIKKSPVPAVCGKAEELPFPDKSFDIVISLTAIHNFGCFEQGIKEMKRVAKRDVAISVLKKAKKFNEIENAIRKTLKVVKAVKERHDVIFFCEAFLRALNSENKSKKS